MCLHSESFIDVNRMRIFGHTWLLFLRDLGKLIGWIPYMSDVTNISITLSHEYQKGGKLNGKVVQMTK